MEIRAAEISDVIKKQIAEYSRDLEVRETGVVLSCGDGIARIYGLDKAAPASCSSSRTAFTASR